MRDSINLGESITVWANGEEVLEYRDLLELLRQPGNLEYTIRVKDRDIQFTVRGPDSWKFQGLRSSESRVGGFGLNWSSGSYMGPVEVDFVLRDIIVGRHGSVGEWVGLRTRDNL